MKEIILPEPTEGFEYVLVPKQVNVIEQLNDNKQSLENDLIVIQEPTNEELIEFGKMFHPYYNRVVQLEDINNKIKNL